MKQGDADREKLTDMRINNRELRNRSTPEPTSLVRPCQLMYPMHENTLYPAGLSLRTSSWLWPSAPSSASALSGSQWRRVLNPHTAAHMKSHLAWPMLL